MLPECTPAVQRALHLAQRWADWQQAPEVGPAHVLAGLLSENSGQAAALLADLGLDLPTAQHALGETPPLDSPAPALRRPLSLATQRAVMRALEMTTAAWGQRLVASEPLVLALLQVDDELTQTLVALGLSRTRLQDRLHTAQPTPLPVEMALELPEPTEPMDTARILDANANRAREALRVVEDYCRFVLQDAFLSSSLKQLRHDLAEALTVLAPSLLLEARETQHDVGTMLVTEREQRRHTLREVALVNLKRLQEALRSLEEVSKLRYADLGRALEQLRYRSYTLERAVLLGSDARQRLARVSLYVLLTGAQCAAALDWTIREAAAGGAGIFQLREKNLDDRALLERARNVRRWTHEVGALFIVNDRPDIARLVEADGVHLGQEDLPVQEARRLLGPDRLIGVSTHNLTQLRQALLDGASYVGVGPTFPSGTKEFAEFAGLDYVRQASAETALPAFVIGGVTLTNVDAVLAAGGRRVAVGQALCQADDPRRVAAEFVRRLQRAQPQS